MVGMNEFGADVEQLTHNLLDQTKGTYFISFMCKEHLTINRETP